VEVLSVGLDHCVDFDVSAIFTRVVMKGSVPAGISKSADSVLGFFSIRIAIVSVLGTALSMVIGTTAPFSAMSGAVIWIWALSVEPPPPRAFSVAATVLESNAALFHCWAKASPGRTSPAAVARARTTRAAARLQCFAPVPRLLLGIPERGFYLGTGDKGSAVVLGRFAWRGLFAGRRIGKTSHGRIASTSVVPSRSPRSSERFLFDKHVEFLGELVHALLQQLGSTSPTGCPAP